MPTITTVIFDMYETLVRDRNDSWRLSFAAIIEEQSLGVTPDALWDKWRQANEDFRLTRTDPSLPFRTYRDTWQEAFADAFDAMKLSGDSVAATDRFFVDLARRQPYPEATAAVRAVQDCYRTAILSNADNGYLMPNLALLDVEFETVVTSESARVYKPLPEVFQVALRELSVAPEEAVYVGDRLFEDVHGAAQAGMNPVWINRHNQPLEPGLPTPEHEISNLMELSALLNDAFR